MEAFENIAKESADKAMMAQNAPATAARATLNTEFNAHLAPYAVGPPDCGVKTTQANLKAHKIVTWKPFGLDVYDAYIVARNARPDLLQIYEASFAAADTLKDAHV